MPKPMPKPTCALLFLALATVLLPACASTGAADSAALPGAPGPSPGLAEARDAWLRGDYAAASRSYERAALAQPPAVAAEFWLASAEAAVAARDADRALALAAHIPLNALAGEKLGRLQLLRAESLLLKNLPFEAAKALPASSEQMPGLAARIEAARARALFGSTEPAAPVAQTVPLAVPAAAEGTAPVVVAGPVNAGGAALLLPLSGSFGASAEAVRDGYLAAHFRNGAAGRVRVYDVGSAASADATLAAYQQALTDGAAVIVGPLRKESVAAMAQLGSPAVPVLALNYLDDSQQAPSRFLQFGLAPEDEARTAAEHAAGQGLRRAVALVPTSDWGERSYAAFRQRFQALGGQVVEVSRYPAGQKDFSTTVRTLLRAQKDAGPKLAPGAVPPARRRTDIDMVFLVARQIDARLIGSMLRFYFAGDLPMYATSAIYAGRPDNDTGGMRFCDMPWMLSAQAYPAERAEAAQLPSQRRDPRLFAFGYDAQAIAATLRPGATLSRMPGMTGLLSIGANGAVRRGLQCAEIQPDSLLLLETPAAVVGPAQ
ncbi:penicillin-binding protein activator [Solimonas sp. K1W22B-7]|uniref:penicillin-binding protein activator n=1 Tax=Solimonas sp. K1W22B-7 TaxID=2303331 RepID=UPI000E3341C9|nr:penicillin-binding protein activator [Solimonas sp. K1W22B-7]AXQ28178.1 penicillin-binding protein activator [Solimonas sp. K1W22B-7]